MVAQTVSERLIACMVMLLGGFLFSWIITKVSSALNADSAEALGAGPGRCCSPHILVSLVKWHPMT